MESLIKGAPHHISNGAILLALSAWHLYPDMFFAGTNQHISQSDPLVSQGGLMSIGLTNKTEDGKGVFWSLPLTQARYYGEPITATRHAGVGESQVQFEDFTLVAIGSALGSWQQPVLNVDDALELIKHISNAAVAAHKKAAAFRNWSGHDWAEWLSLFTAAIDRYTQSTGVEKQNLTRLIRFGQRNCAAFLASPQNYPAPAFGLSNFSLLMKFFGTDTEAAISFLRGWGARELEPRTAAAAVIRYRVNRGAIYHYTYIDVDVDDSEPPSKKQKFENDPSIFENGHSIKSTSSRGIRWSEDDDEQFSTSDFLHGWLKDEEEFSRAEFFDDAEERIQEFASIPPSFGAQPEPYYFVCGDVKTAIYLPSSHKLRKSVWNNCMDVMQLHRCIKEGNISSAHIVKTLEEVSKSTSLEKSGDYFESLCAIGTASKIYSRLPGARVDLQVIRMQISKSKWWQSLKSLVALQSMKLRTTMCCIAFFETGTIDLNPEELGDHSFAVCHSNSIFVGSRLLSDPINEIPQHFIERIIGNVGKPGLTFLVTPPDPMVQDFDPSLWHLIAHEKFDGRAQDSFQGTSFHLSFTGYEHSLHDGQRSVRDVPARLLETAVSVYDRGKWIADLDILEASMRWMRVPKLSCPHLDGAERGVSDLDLVSVDTWMELLDPPQEGQNSVVRAHDNPIARIAAAALAVRKRRSVIILPNKVCWQCQSLKAIEGQLCWVSGSDVRKLQNEFRDSNSVGSADMSSDGSETDDDEDEDLATGAFLIY